MVRDVSPLSVHDVRPLNRAAMLGHLRRHGPTTRGTLARRLQLSNSAVTNVAAELLAEGVLIDRQPVDGGSTRLGRPSTELAIDASSRHVIGVQVGVGVIRAGICDLLGDVVARGEDTFDVSTDSAPASKAIVGVVKRLVRRRNANGLLGIGVGAPGPVDAARRVNLMAINLGWTDVHFADELEAAFELPTVVDHNIRAMALAEARFGRWKGVESLAFVYVGSGVGAGLVMNGEAYGGGILGVTEFGHLSVAPGGPLCVCGNRGCLEAVASEPALAKAVVAAAKARGGARLRAAIEAGEAPTRALLTAAAEGDRAATSIVERFVDDLVSGLVSLANLLNPELIVLGGYLATAEAELLPLIRDALQAHAFPMLRSSIRVEATSFGLDSGIAGAAAVALDRLFYEPQPRERNGRRPTTRVASR